MNESSEDRLRHKGDEKKKKVTDYRKMERDDTER